MVNDYFFELIKEEKIHFDWIISDFHFEKPQSNFILFNSNLDTLLLENKIKKSDKMKLRYKISIWVALALAGSLLWGGSIWLWLAGIYAGKFLIRLLLTITLAIAAYILAYALTIGGILWLLIS